MKTNTNLVILFLVISSSIYGQTNIERGEITDVRDGNKYQTVTINNTIWLAENMKFKTENSYILIDNANRLKSEGHYYPMEESEKVCPDGYRIPIESEWEEYVQILMELKNVPMDSIEYISLTNRQGSSKEMKNPIRELTFFEEPNPLNLKATGIIQGNKHLIDGAMSFWSRKDGSNDLKYHLHIEDNFYSNHSHKHHIIARKKKKRKFHIRCVKNIN